MANPIVVDLSHHNPEPDWKALRKGGTQGVILKATQGVGFIDGTFMVRRNNALEAGLYVASYHFLERGNVAEQMAHYLSTVDPESYERLVIDYEECDDDTPTVDDLVEAVTILMDLGYETTIYGGYKLKEDCDVYMPDLAGTSLWIAHYTDASQPTWPDDQWSHWSLWQYTDCADVVGISEPVDGNRWNGDAAQLRNWFYRPMDSYA